jgi:hypothetical protein
VVAVRTALHECQERIDRRESADRIEPRLATEAMENAEAAEAMEPSERMEPVDPTERIEPTEPTDRIDPLDLMLSSESCDAIDHREPLLSFMAAFSRSQAAVRTLTRLYTR